MQNKPLDALGDIYPLQKKCAQMTQSGHAVRYIACTKTFISCKVTRVGSLSSILANKRSLSLSYSLSLLKHGHRVKYCDLNLKAAKSQNELFSIQLFFCSFRGSRSVFIM
jgi:hypothetical protein